MDMLDMWLKKMWTNSQQSLVARTLMMKRKCCCKWLVFFLFFLFSSSLSFPFFSLPYLFSTRSLALYALPLTRTYTVSVLFTHIPPSPFSLSLLPNTMESYENTHTLSLLRLSLTHTRLQASHVCCAAGTLLPYQVLLAYRTQLAGIRWWAWCKVDESAWV